MTGIDQRVQCTGDRVDVVLAGIVVTGALAFGAGVAAARRDRARRAA